MTQPESRPPWQRIVSAHHAGADIVVEFDTTTDRGRPEVIALLLRSEASLYGLDPDAPDVVAEVDAALAAALRKSLPPAGAPTAPAAFE